VPRVASVCACHVAVDDDDDDDEYCSYKLTLSLSLSLSLSLLHEKVERIKETPNEVEMIVYSDTTSYQDKIVEVPYTYIHT